MVRGDNTRRELSGLRGVWKQSVSPERELRPGRTSVRQLVIGNAIMG